MQVFSLNWGHDYEGQLGHLYCATIQTFMDGLKQKHFPRMFSLSKNANRRKTYVFQFVGGVLYKCSTLLPHRKKGPGFESTGWLGPPCPVCMFHLSMAKEVHVKLTGHQHEWLFVSVC